MSKILSLYLQRYLTKIFIQPDSQKIYTNKKKLYKFLNHKKLFYNYLCSEKGWVEVRGLTSDSPSSCEATKEGRLFRGKEIPLSPQVLYPLSSCNLRRSGLAILEDSPFSVELEELWALAKTSAFLRPSRGSKDSTREGRGKGLQSPIVLRRRPKPKELRLKGSPKGTASPGGGKKDEGLGTFEGYSFRGKLGSREGNWNPYGERPSTFPRAGTLLGPSRTCLAKHRQLPPPGLAVPFATLGPQHFQLMRPLLSITRLDTFYLCQILKLPVYPDKSNLKLQFLRNRIRKQILPAIRILINPQIDTIVCNFSESFLSQRSQPF